MTTCIYISASGRVFWGSCFNLKDCTLLTNTMSDGGVYLSEHAILRYMVGGATRLFGLGLCLSHADRPFPHP